jgi:amino acid transporter
MLLSVALFGLFMTGCWLYCLTDAILTPAPECRGLSKQAWVAVIAVTFIGGALAWLVIRRSVRGLSASQRWTAADDAAARHPAGRAKAADHPGTPKGPDDDREFLRALEQAIRRNPPVS